jgi:ankyrin repeat protein
MNALSYKYTLPRQTPKMDHDVTVSLGLRSFQGLLTVDDVNNADVTLLMNEEYSAFSVLYWTCQKCPSEVVERVLDKTKIDVNIRTRKYEYTALMGASLGNRLETVKLLLKRGADVTIKNNFGNTALHLAACNGASNELLQVLIHAGGDVNAVNNDGKSVVDIAYKCPETEVFLKSFVPPVKAANMVV